MSLKKSLSYVAVALFLVVLLGANGCDNLVTGSGETITLDMDYTDFNQIEVSMTFDIAIERADSFIIRITVDKNLDEYLKIDQRGDTLRIGLKSNYSYLNTTQRAIVNLPDLRRLKLTDSSSAVVSGFSSSHSLEFELHDASRVVLSRIIAGDTSFSLSDASEVTGTIEMDDGDFRLNDSSSLDIEGSGKDIKIDGAASSDIELSEFPVDTAAVELSSASRAVINVSTRMDIELSSASTLEYIGNPKLGRLDVSGDSTLEQIQ